MTVSTSINSVVYRGNGAATQFAVPFKVLDEDHFVVRRRMFATGIIDYTYVGTDYSYVGIGASSGTLTLDGAALDDDYELVIERIVPYTQDLDIVNAGGFYPETVEEQLDLIMMGVQQLADLAGRGAVVPIGEEGLELPKASDRAGMFFGFDAEGNFAALSGDGADSALRTDLAASTGAALIGTRNGLSLQTALGSILGPSGDTTGVADRAALVAALTAISAGGEVSFIPGDYYFDTTVEITKINITLKGLGHVTFRPKASLTLLDPMFWFKVDGGRIDNINFIGSAYTTEGSDSGLNVNRFVLVGLTTGVKVNFSANRMTTYGGRSAGLWCTNTNRVDITKCLFEKCYYYGLCTPSCQKLIVDGITCIDMGIGEGIKFSFEDDQITEEILITNFLIDGCGKLSATIADWQEGMDLFINNAQDINISNGIIRNCGNGGIEIKTNVTYGAGKVAGAFAGIRNATVDNVDVIMGYDHGVGFAANWGEALDATNGDTNPTASAADLSQKLTLRNFNVTYRPVAGQPATATVAQGVLITAWTDTLLDTVRVDDCLNGIRLAGDGSSDATNRRTTIINPKIRCVEIGIYVANGTFEEPLIIGGDVRARIPLYLGGGGYTGAGSVTGGGMRDTRLVSSGTTDGDSCVGMTNVFGFVIEDVYMESAYRSITTAGAVVGPVGGRTSGGRVRRCTMKTVGTDTAKYHYAFAGNHGTWIVTDNEIEFDASMVLGRTLVQTSGSVTGANNSRGLRSSIPSIGGSIGDIYRHSAPTSPGFMGWVATSLSDTAAAWDEYGPVA